jgi:hypothetical protein
MSRTVDYLPFSINIGSNVQGQSSYVIEPIRLTGHQAGVAKSAVVNKSLRQSSVMVAALANMLSEALDVDLFDNGDVAALTALLQDVILGGRKGILTAPTTFYVRSTGSDNNDGLTPSSAWATPQHAWNELFLHHNTNGQRVLIDIGAGTFPPLIISNPVIGGGYLEIYGAGMGSTTINADNAIAIFLTNNSFANVHDMKLQSNGTDFNTGFNLFLYHNSIMDAHSIHFGTTGGWGTPQNGCHILAGIGSMLYLGQFNTNTAYTVSGDAACFVNCSEGSVAAFANAVITLSGTRNWRESGIVSTSGSVVSFYSLENQTPCAFIGTATGSRFAVDGVSRISTATGGDVNWIPGSVPGSWVNNNVQFNYT